MGKLRAEHEPQTVAIKRSESPFFTFPFCLPWERRAARQAHADTRMMLDAANEAHERSGTSDKSTSS